ncbi:MAG: hypothetical protein EHM41_08865 [Chloroflexi bacterium]|nr:MAG: hypothetical protein EHM41_08865 [Chloroflexota bacterium]
MPNIFDNIALPLLPTLKQAIQAAVRADFCVGYFNLRGWKELDPLVEPWLWRTEAEEYHLIKS